MTTAWQIDAFQNNAFQIDATPVIDTDDTHDGFRRQEKRFKSRRVLLRETIERAWDGPQPEPVAKQVREIAAPYVERLESGRLRIDYDGARRVQAEILALQAALRSEFEARMAIEQDDEEVILLMAQ